MAIRKLLLAAAVLAAGCTSPGQSADTTSTRAPFTTAPTTTSTTVDPASSLMPQPAPVAGIWLTEFGGVVLQFRIDQGQDQELTALFDSPMEGASDLPATISAEGVDVTIEIPIASATFEGTVEGDSLAGVWKQGGAEVPMLFARQAEPFAVSRPQEPQPPFPYESVDVQFSNGPIPLSGTLVIPKGEGPFPVAVLISGSGQQDRDESLMGHRPFLVLSDWLARQGVATLRYDDRGVGGSGGNPVGATTADFAEDARAAVVSLAGDQRFSAIGLIGHSEGGLIAPMVAGQSDEIDFVVLLAGPGLSGADVLAKQIEELMRAEGAARSAVDWRVGWGNEVIALAASEAASLDVASQIRQILEAAAADAPPGLEQLVGDTAIEETVAVYTDPWMRYFLAYDPQSALQELAIPVLALIGDLDLQVSAELNVPALEDALAGNADATVIELSGLNHLFQTATTGAVSEYGQIEETFAPHALELVSDWILRRF
ncbi:MAG: alpha/beta fold hydrolase [Acidimicrobiia bacterium]|nr:alpha/beta fold hydrolase [Acidimicrobiia bacterium]